MGGVEISADMCEDVEALADDLARRRADLASVTIGLIVPVGHLFDYEAPTNTCAIHVHVSGVENKTRLYGNIIHFLPVLAAVHDQLADGGVAILRPVVSDGQLVGHRPDQAGLAVSVPGRDPFQAARHHRASSFRPMLGPESHPLAPARGQGHCRAERMRSIPPSTATTPCATDSAARVCSTRSSDLVDELRGLIDFPIELLEHTASDELKAVYDSEGLIAAYSALDNGYRNGVFEPRPVPFRKRAGMAKGMLGFVGYFVPRLPYYAWKGLVE